jgi:hypothetical protein
MRMKVGERRWAGRANRPQGVPENSKPPPSLTEKLMWDGLVATPSSPSSASKLG